MGKLRRGSVLGVGVSALLAMFVGLSSSISAGTFTLTDSTPGNFDGGSGSRTLTVTGAEPGFDTGIITDINISINFAKAAGGNFDPPYSGGFPFYDEIHFQLTHGATTHLIEPLSWGAGSGQFDGTIAFDDEALAVVNFGAAPVAGTFRPTGPGTLATFDTSLATGVWTLFIEDTASLDSLRFRNFTLEVSTVPSAVPEPASLTLLGLGVAGAIAYRRRAR